MAWAPRAVRPPDGKGAVRLSLTGIMAASDDFSRVRVLLLDIGRDGASDVSWRALRRAVRPPNETGAGRGFRVPYEIAGDLEAARDGVRGVFWAVLPSHREHWLAVASELRGRWVRAEVLVRPYTIRARGPAPGPPARGAALDLADLEAC